MTIKTIRHAFERVVVINLNRRPDRWQRFCDNIKEVDWQLNELVRIQAIDGNLCPPPEWWRASKGAWGCFRTHILVLERALRDGVKSLLVFEDDALLPNDFNDRIARFMRKVPRDWDQVYLGGQHLNSSNHPPAPINSLVVRCHNVNRTHAYAVKDRYILDAYRHLNDYPSHCKRSSQHVDHCFGYLHELKNHNIYAPRTWIVGQAESLSDIEGRKVYQRFWHGNSVSFQMTNPNRSEIRRSSKTDRRFRNGLAAESESSIPSDKISHINPIAIISAAKRQSTYHDTMEWRRRRIQSSYPYVYLSGISFERRFVTKTFSYSLLYAIGVSYNGIRDVLGVEDGSGDRARTLDLFLRQLIERGLTSVGLFIIDGTAEISKSLSTFFPQIPRQYCVDFLYKTILDDIPEQPSEDFISLLKSIHVQRSRIEAKAKTKNIKNMLRQKGLSRAANTIDKDLSHTLVYYDFPQEHWPKINKNRSSNTLMRYLIEKTLRKRHYASTDALLLPLSRQLKEYSHTVLNNERFIDWN